MLRVAVCTVSCPRHSSNRGVCWTCVRIKGLCWAVYRTETDSKTVHVATVAAGMEDLMAAWIYLLDDRDEFFKVNPHINETEPPHRADSPPC